MPNILKRIGSVLTTSMNDLIDRVEDPERTIRHMLREMEDKIAQAQEGIIDAAVSEQRLHEDLNDHNRQAQEWSHRAEEALQAGRRDLARTAVKRQKEHEYIIETLESSWQVAKQTVAGLKAQVLALHTKLGEAKRMQAVLAARHRAARAQQTLERTLAKVQSLHSSTSPVPLNDTFSQAVDKIKNMESKARVLADLVRDNAQPEQDFLVIQMEQDIEAELARIEMKVQAKLLSQPEQSLIPAFPELRKTPPEPRSQDDSDTT